jgi:hypothetical protein
LQSLERSLALHNHLAGTQVRQQESAIFSGSSPVSQTWTLSLHFRMSVLAHLPPFVFGFAGTLGRQEGQQVSVLNVGNLPEAHLASAFNVSALHLVFRPSTAPFAFLRPHAFNLGTQLGQQSEPRIFFSPTPQVPISPLSIFVLQAVSLSFVHELAATLQVRQLSLNSGFLSAAHTAGTAHTFCSTIVGLQLGQQVERSYLGRTPSAQAFAVEVEPLLMHVWIFSKVQSAGGVSDAVGADDRGTQNISLSLNLHALVMVFSL